MQKIIIYLMIALLTFASRDARSQGNLIEKYYENVRKAERCIIENIKDSACFYYSKAFMCKREPFTRDIYNAAVASVRSKQEKDAHKYLTILAQRGLGYAELIRQEDFKVFFDSGVSRKARKNFKKTELTYDTNYRKQILYLVERDQKFRLLPNSYKLYLDSIKQIDRDNINALFELVKTLGFPTDDKIGINRLSEITNPIYAVLFVHQSAGPVQQFDLSSFLTEHILKGNLENKPGFFFLERNIGSDFIQVVNLSYVKVIDSTRSSSNPNNFIMIDSTAYGYYPLDDKMLANTNKKRRAFYLDDHELNMRKVLFSISNDAFRFDYIGSKSGMIYTNIRDFLEAKKGLKYFE